MLRVGCGNSVRNHRLQWALSPASRFQAVRCPEAETGLCGALGGALNRRAADIEPRTSAMRRGTDLNPPAVERRHRATKRHSDDLRRACRQGENDGDRGFRPARPQADY